jgi:F0F1-type ATP synthase epsilon subunit
MSNHKLIRVIIRDTGKILFDGEVDRISSFNEVGRFDVYPMHANFISIINQEITLYNKNEKIKEIKIEQAIMKVKQDLVHIFLGIETLFVDENSSDPLTE